MTGFEYLLAVVGFGLLLLAYPLFDWIVTRLYGPE